MCALQTTCPEKKPGRGLVRWLGEAVGTGQAHADAMGNLGGPADQRDAVTGRRAWENDGRIDLRSVTNAVRQLPYHVAYTRRFRECAAILNPTRSIDWALESVREMEAGKHPLITLAVNLSFLGVPFKAPWGCLRAPLAPLISSLPIKSNQMGTKSEPRYQGQLVCACVRSGAGCRDMSNVGRFAASLLLFPEVPLSRKGELPGGPGGRLRRERGDRRVWGPEAAGAGLVRAQEGADGVALRFQGRQGSRAEEEGGARAHAGAPRRVSLCFGCVILLHVFFWAT